MRALVVVALAACGARPTPDAGTPPLIGLEGSFEPSQASPWLVLAPQLRCDGQAVLVPLERRYGSRPVAAAVLDRAGRVQVRFDLDAPTGDAVRRKIDAANRALAASCWRPLALAADDTYATWGDAAIALRYRGRPYTVAAPPAAAEPEERCRPVSRIAAVHADDAHGLVLVAVAREVADHCGGLPDLWLVVDVTAAGPGGPPAFVCGFPTRAAFDAAVDGLRARPAAAVGDCRATIDGDYLTVARGDQLVYRDKDGGAAWAFDRAFAVHGIRPGDDAGAAAAAAAATGRARIRCAPSDDQVACAFRAPGTGECGDAIDVLIAPDPTATDPELVREPEELRGRTVVAVATVMPC